MSGKPKTYEYKSLDLLTNRLRDDLKSGGRDFILLFAYNGTGKTRLSMSFKDIGKMGDIDRDTLYFNAFTEDLFTWDNDLDEDVVRRLKINTSSRFFVGIEKNEMENRIRPLLHRYADFDFSIDYTEWTISFSREIIIKVPGESELKTESIENIKVSRGEENIFIWCFFLAIAQLAIDGDEDYKWVKYIYIDDPISSLDDNNAIALASDLIKEMLPGKNHIKFLISTHHSLFFNVLWNEIKKHKHKSYFLYKNNNPQTYILRSTNDTPFFHHVAMLTELQRAVEADKLYTYHFNMLRSILEKTATFFGFNNFSTCIHGVEDEILFTRALNLLSHGKYSIFEPREMVPDTKNLFKKILSAFLERYQFDLPELIPNPTEK